MLLPNEIKVPSINFNIINKSGEAEAFLEFYNIINKKHDYHFGHFLSKNNKITAHIFKNSYSIGTIYLLHGFLDHSGVLSKLINNLLKDNYSIAVFDLLGHGLSDGAKTEVESFDDYVVIFSDFIKITRSVLKPPYHIIAHSTGTAVVYDYLNNYDDIFEKVIFAAPLVRSKHWQLAKFSRKITDDIIKDFPRVFRNVSSDKTFLKFQKYSDPLQPKKISLKWVKALYNWNEKIKNYSHLDRELMIIQGTKDNIVEWKYNLKYFEIMMKKVIIKMIKDGRHQLFNENKELFAKVFECIKEYLK